MAIVTLTLSVFSYGVWGQTIDSDPIPRVYLKEVSKSQEVDEVHALQPLQIQPLGSYWHIFVEFQTLIAWKAWHIC